MTVEKSSARKKIGFTLVELLVVIAIIGVLVALLLPAVQAAREAARRSQCTNNTKQLGLALLNYESTHGTLPSLAYKEGARTPAPDNERIRYGYSWIIRVLPFAEYGNISDQLVQANPDRGYPWAAGNAQNLELLSGVELPLLVCPSSTLERFSNSGRGPARSFYTGIHGSGRNVLPSGVELDTGGGQDAPREFAYDGRPRSNLGFVSDRGAFQLQAAVSLRQVIDGTTNTLVVGEQSDFMPLSDDGLTLALAAQWDGGELPEGLDMRSDCGHSITMGPARGWPRIFNSTNVRYPINHPDASDAGIAGNCGRNRPINSAHPGGAHVLSIGGDVQFLSEDTDIDILWNLADRDDSFVSAQ